MKAHYLERLIVRTAPGSRQTGIMIAGRRTFKCALGRSGIGNFKREGDGKTPRGRFALLSAKIRPDRLNIRSARLPFTCIKPENGWCDAPRHPRYNCPVDLPFPASHEKLHREDQLYDCFVVMDHNISRHLSVGGSAIFFHLAHDDYRPTEGCVAISIKDMEWLWPRIGPRTVIVVE